MWSPWAFYTGGMMLGTYSIMSIILLSLFVKKLRQITSQRLVSAQSDLSLKMAYSSSTNDNVSDNDNDTNDNVGGGGRSPSASSVESMDRHDFELIQIMTKYTILVFFAVMTTTTISVVNVQSVCNIINVFLYCIMVGYNGFNIEYNMFDITI